MECIRRRRSIRKYKNQPLEEGVVLKILEAGRLAPSGKNRQPWRFILITDDGLKTALAETTIYKFIKDAPLLVAACALPSSSTLGPVADVVIALDHMSLAAAAEGVGSCWVAGFDRRRAAPLLGVPPGVELVALMGFGYPDESPSAPRRKPLEEMVFLNAYDVPYFRSK